MTIRTPAARVKQGDLVVYLTSIKVKNLIADGFYTVDTLDPKSDEGYQRLLNNGRAKKLADYVIKGQDTSPFKVHVTRTSEAPPQTNKHVG